MLHVGPPSGPPSAKGKVADSFGPVPAIVSFDPCGRTCIVGSADGSIAFYTLEGHAHAPAHEAGSKDMAVSGPGEASV